MDDYKPNINRFAPLEERQSGTSQKKEVKPVAKGKPKEKTGLDKLLEVFDLGDLKDVRNMLVKDVLIPKAKDLLFYIITDGTDAVLNRSNSSSNKIPAEQVSYNRYWKGNNSSIKGSNLATTQTVNRYNTLQTDIQVDSQREADAVLEGLNGMLSQFGIVSIGDLYGLCGITTSNYQTACKYGWRDISSAKVQKVPGGYMIVMPKPVPFD